MQLVFDAVLWEHDGQASWHFVTLPPEVADEIEDARMASEPRGFGSVPVEVRIGGSTWRTSLFPSKAASSFVLPVKKAVRSAEGVSAGDAVTVQLDL